MRTPPTKPTVPRPAPIPIFVNFYCIIKHLHPTHNQPGASNNAATQQFTLVLNTQVAVDDQHPIPVTSDVTVQDSPPNHRHAGNGHPPRQRSPELRLNQRKAGLGVGVEVDSEVDDGLGV